MLRLYTAEQAQALDRRAIEQHGIPGLVLMKRAAEFAFHVLQQAWPQARDICIVCGPGKNAGDGYALAKIAQIAGFNVSLCQIEQAPMHGDAAQARKEAEALGIYPTDFSLQQLQQADVLVDALFGIGLNRPLEQPWLNTVATINQSGRPVLAMDIPSGLDANTGAVLGAAIKASHTACFIVNKIGLFINQGLDYAGDVHLNDLSFPQELLRELSPLAISWNQDDLPQLVRAKNTHKGSYGTALIIGGNNHMLGAIALAAQACLRSGAGLVKLISRTEHLIPLTQIQPELMCYEGRDFYQLSAKTNVIAIGPGLGNDNWAWDLYEKVCKSEQPLVLDADALNCLALEPFHYERWILTPHPAEAGRLLERPTQVIQNDRVAAIQALHKRYGGVIVLKGAGTLIYDGERMALCRAGNPGMAVGGMGDVLTGLIAGLVAQDYNLFDAAHLGVELHARTADQIVQTRSEASLLPSDIINAL